MRDKLNKFMQGRYGVDQLSRFTLGVALFIVVIGSFCRRNMAGGVLDLLGFVLIIYTYVRILSRNIQKRYAENQKYLSGYPIFFSQLPAETAVKGSIQIKILKPDLRFIHYHIAKHFISS